MTDSRHLLISVVETLADSVAGYEHIGDHAHGFRLYAYCEHQAILRKKTFHNFVEQMKAHGWPADFHGTILGSAHRLFVDLRMAITRDEGAIIAELHRGESFLLNRIQTALAEGRFDIAIAEELERVAAEVGSAVNELAAQLRGGFQGRALPAIDGHR